MLRGLLLGHLRNLTSKWRKGPAGRHRPVCSLRVCGDQSLPGANLFQELQSLRDVGMSSYAGAHHADALKQLKLRKDRWAHSDWMKLCSSHGREEARPS